MRFGPFMLSPHAYASVPREEHQGPHSSTAPLILTRNVFIYSLICDIDFIMVISDHYLDTRVCLYSNVVCVKW